LNKKRSRGSFDASTIPETAHLLWMGRFTSMVRQAAILPDHFYFIANTASQNRFTKKQLTTKNNQY
jgi:hypothetical protein